MGMRGYFRIKIQNTEYLLIIKANDCIAEVTVLATHFSVYCLQEICVIPTVGNSLRKLIYRTVSYTDFFFLIVSAGPVGLMLWIGQPRTCSCPSIAQQSVQILSLQSAATSGYWVSDDISYLLSRLFIGFLSSLLGAEQVHSANKLTSEVWPHLRCWIYFTVGIRLNTCMLFIGKQQSFLQPSLGACSNQN